MQSDIFDFGFDTKAQSATDSNFEVKKNGVERWRENAETVMVMNSLIPDSKSRENFLSNGIQHIYKLGYQRVMAKFVKHAKCENSLKKAIRQLRKLEILGNKGLKKIAVQEPNGVRALTRN